MLHVTIEQMLLCLEGEQLRCQNLPAILLPHGLDNRSLLVREPLLCIMTGYCSCAIFTVSPVACISCQPGASSLGNCRTRQPHVRPLRRPICRSPLRDYWVCDSG